MRICYIARHDQQLTSNDDEGAISHALEVLGHQVTRVHENIAAAAPTDGFDLMLFHKLDEPAVLDRFAGKCKRAFWFFDLVDWRDDHTVERRNEARKAWMHRTIPNVEVGFCTDGDWVERWNRLFPEHPRLYTLRQGADERVVGYGNYQGEPQPDRILFVGGRVSSQGRRDWFDMMREHYGPSFWHINSGVYGRQLADQIAGASIVVCPPSPVTHKYWSNRVYVMSGFGACVLHPYCADLMPAEGLGSETRGFIQPGQYAEAELEILAYSTEERFHETINNLLHNKEVLEEVRHNALTATLKRNLYQHQCERLIQFVENL